VSFRHRRGRTRSDTNMQTIVAELRERGYTVVVLSGVGGGAPDLLVARAGQLWLCEVKRTLKDVLTPDQLAFHGAWPGPPILVICSAAEFEIQSRRPAARRSSTAAPVTGP